MGRSQDGEDRSTVLVVDDEPQIADLFTNILANEYAVQTAYSGMEALDMVDPDLDVVLLDRRMPIVSGDEVLEQIREQDIDCRIVLVTAIKPDLGVIELDFDDYLVKPVSEGELRNVVERMLRREAYDEQLQEAVALASKMATLESKMDIAELESSEEYAALEARFLELREVLDGTVLRDDLYAEGTTEKIRALFEEPAITNRDPNVSEE